MDAQNIFSYCVGALALLSTISSVLFYCGLYLPTNQLRVLDALLLETSNIYQKVNDEGLLPGWASRYAQTRLRRYKDDTETLREETYRARSCLDTVSSLFRGHVARIMGLADAVKHLRAFLMTTSQEEKARRLQQEGRRGHVTSSAQEVSESAAEENTARFDGLAGVGQATYESSLPSDSATSTMPSLPLDVECLRNDSVLSNSDTVSISFSLDGNRCTACFVCSSWEWLTRKTSRTATNLQSHEVWREGPSSDASTASRTSTLVNTRQARSPMLSSWISLAGLVTASSWRFPSTPTNFVASSPHDDALHTSPV